MTDALLNKIAARQQDGKHLVIAIDGPAASGKGTLSRKLSEILSCAMLDTGALYRYVAYRALEDNIEIDHAGTAGTFTRNLAPIIQPENLEIDAIRTDKVAQATSIMSKHAAVRDALLAYQRDFAKHPEKYSHTKVLGAVLDGRDIGTVICPNADIKFFVTAKPDIRAERRFKELQSKGIQVTYDAVLADIKSRDARDSQRDTAPLTVADDAVVIDTSDQSIADMLSYALSVIEDTLSE